MNIPDLTGQSHADAMRGHRIGVLNYYLNSESVAALFHVVGAVPEDEDTNPMIEQLIAESWGLA